MSKNYTIGVGYGTQSGRAVLVEVETAVKTYSHSVMNEYLPDGKTNDVMKRLKKIQAEAR